jgi:hypothetical protein
MLKIVIALFFCFFASAANAQTVSSSEAEAAARKYWNLVLTQCSDSYYYSWERILDGTETTQYKRISIPARMAVMILEPSEADRLNGLTWRGTIVVNVGLNRKFSTINGRREWSDWSDGHQIKLGMWKDKGHWLVNPNEWGDGSSIDIELLHKSSCMDIPGTQEYDKSHPEKNAASH